MDWARVSPSISLISMSMMAMSMACRSSIAAQEGHCFSSAARIKGDHLEMLQVIFEDFAIAGSIVNNENAPSASCGKSGVNSRFRSRGVRGKLEPKSGALAEHTAHADLACIILTSWREDGQSRPEPPTCEWSNHRLRECVKDDRKAVGRNATP